MLADSAAAGVNWPSANPGMDGLGQPVNDNGAQQPVQQTQRSDSAVAAENKRRALDRDRFRRAAEEGSRRNLDNVDRPAAQRNVRQMRIGVNTHRDVSGSVNVGSNAAQLRAAAKEEKKGGFDLAGLGFLAARYLGKKAATGLEKWGAEAEEQGVSRGRVLTQAVKRQLAKVPMHLFDRAATVMGKGESFANKILGAADSYHLNQGPNSLGEIWLERWNKLNTATNKLVGKAAHYENIVYSKASKEPGWLMRSGQWLKQNAIKAGKWIGDLPGISHMINGLEWVAEKGTNLLGMGKNKAGQLAEKLTSSKGAQALGTAFESAEKVFGKVSESVGARWSGMTNAVRSTAANGLREVRIFSGRCAIYVEERAAMIAQNASQLKDAGKMFRGEMDDFASMGTSWVGRRFAGVSNKFNSLAKAVMPGAAKEAGEEGIEAVAKKATAEVAEQGAGKAIGRVVGGAFAAVLNLTTAIRHTGRKWGASWAGDQEAAYVEGAQASAAFSGGTASGAAAFVPYAGLPLSVAGGVATDIGVDKVKDQYQTALQTDFQEHQAASKEQAAVMERMKAARRSGNQGEFEQSQQALTNLREQTRHLMAPRDVVNLKQDRAVNEVLSETIAISSSHDAGSYVAAKIFSGGFARLVRAFDGNALILNERQQGAQTVAGVQPATQAANDNLAPQAQEVSRIRSIADVSRNRVHSAHPLPHTVEGQRAALAS